MVKFVVVLGLALCVSALALPSPTEHQLEKGVSCNPDLCKLPNCRCSSTELDESIPTSETPQVGLENDSLQVQSQVFCQLCDRWST